MVIHNVTSKVDHRIHTDWLNWMERAYLPAIMESGAVAGYQLARLLGVDESDGVTYALMLTFDSRMVFDIYQEKHALAHQQAIRDKWGDGVLGFASSLNVVLRG